MIMIWNNKYQGAQETQDSWCGSWLAVPVVSEVMLERQDVSIINYLSIPTTSDESSLPPPTD